MKLRLLFVMSVVLAVGVAVSAASAGEGNPPNVRKQCTKGHWTQWKTTNGGQAFKSEDKCLNYVLSGGSLPLGFPQSKIDCEALGGTFSTDPASDHLTLNGTFLWSCNNGPSQAFSFSLFSPDCIPDAGQGNNALMGWSLVSPWDSSCYRTT